MSSERSMIGDNEGRIPTSTYTNARVRLAQDHLILPGAYARDLSERLLNFIYCEVSGVVYSSVHRGIIASLLSVSISQFSRGNFPCLLT